MSDHDKNDTRKTSDYHFVYGTADGDQIDGTYKNAIIFGYDGDDEIRAGGGKDYVWGGNGDDLFIFSVNGDDDWVEDFKSGEDTLDVSALGFTDFADMLASKSDVGSNATIDYGKNDEIKLVGVATADLSASDFLFWGLVVGGGDQFRLVVGPRQAAEFHDLDFRPDHKPGTDLLLDRLGQSWSGVGALRRFDLDRQGRHLLDTLLFRTHQHDPADIREERVDHLTQRARENVHTPYDQHVIRPPDAADARSRTAARDGSHADRHMVTRAIPE
jgi:hypothetical protein